MRFRLRRQATIYCVLARASEGFLFKPTLTFTQWISEEFLRERKIAHPCATISLSKKRNTRIPTTVASAAMSASRHLGKLLPSSTVFFACDIQERFRDLILNMPSVISTARFMLDVSETLEVPCVVTEQYPKLFVDRQGRLVNPSQSSTLVLSDNPIDTLRIVTKALLHTVQELSVGAGGKRNKVPVFEKKLFSMCTADVMAHVEALPKKPTDVVLFGIEAHVCVTQTCLDLLEHGYGVHIVCDGVSSQKPYDRTIGLQRMQQVGAFMTTAEQVAFQLAQSADNPNFKAISNLVKGRNEEENAFSSMATL